MLNGVLSMNAVDLTMADIVLDLKTLADTMRLGGGIPYGGILYQSPFTGKITDVNMWSRDLSLEEITAIQTECKYPSAGPDLLSWADSEWDIIGNIR